MAIRSQEDYVTMITIPCADSAAVQMPNASCPL